MTPSYDEIYELYVEQGKSLRQIGALYGVSHQTIHEEMQRLGIARRDPHERLLKTRPLYDIPPDLHAEDKLKLEYINEQIASGRTEDVDLLHDVAAQVLEGHARRQRRALQSRRRVLPSRHGVNL